MKKAIFILLTLCSLTTAQDNKQRVAVIMNDDGNGEPSIVKGLRDAIEQYIQNDMKEHYRLIAIDEKTKDMINKLTSGAMNESTKKEHIIKAENKSAPQYAFIIGLDYDEGRKEYNIKAQKIELETDELDNTNAAGLRERKLQTRPEREDAADIIVRQLIASNNKGVFIDKYYDEYNSDQKLVMRGLGGLGSFQVEGAYCGKGGIEVIVEVTDAGKNGCIIDKGSDANPAERYVCTKNIDVLAKSCDRTINTQEKTNAYVEGKGKNKDEAETEAETKLRDLRLNCRLCKPNSNFRVHWSDLIKKFARGGK